MDEVYLSILYDYYGELLTKKQREYFTNYYFSDLSLGEVGDILKVSRNAIHKQLKIINEKLLFFESKLGLYEKDKKLKSIASKISNKTIVSEIEELIKE